MKCNTLLAGTSICDIGIFFSNILRERSQSNRGVKFAITGEGDARKTTIATELATHLGDCDARIMELDNFSIDRRVREKMKISGYDPAAFDLRSFELAVNDITNGKPTWIPNYDHSVGLSCRDRNCKKHDHLLEPCRVLIGVGIFLWHKANGGPWDIGLYCQNISEDKERQRLTRDILFRGYSTEYAAKHVEMMRNDRLKFIEPSRSHCSYFYSFRESEETLATY